MTTNPPPEQGDNPDWQSALKATLFAFTLSRLLVFLSAAIAVALAQQPWPTAPTQKVRVFTPKVTRQLRDRVLANDANWYASIVKRGYEERPFDASRQANWAFFPLHPILWRTATLSGLGLALSGVLLANLWLLLALFQTHRWVQILYDAQTANRAVLALALFPTSYFLSLPWTESLFLALSASSLLALTRSRFATASAFNALASATRPTGVLLSVLLWWDGRKGQRLPSARIWFLAILGVSGLLAFMLLLYLRTGNPLAFSDIQSAWGRNGGSLTKDLRRWLTEPGTIARFWSSPWINSSSLLFGLVGSAWLWRKNHRGLALFAFVSIALPWATGTLVSMGRYVMCCLPLYLPLACWTRRTPVMLGWMVISACTLVAMTALYALGASFAGA